MVCAAARSDHKRLNFTCELKNIKCPVTILCGEKDRANRKAAKQLQKLLPQAELHLIPGAGHELNRNAPEAIVRILTR